MDILTEGQILFLAFGSLGLGIWMLIRGGDTTVNASVYVAKKFGIPPLLVGCTMIGFGTSLPELIVAINANLKGAGGIALGNILGSNIANILLVVGAAACIAPIIANPKALWRDMVMMIVSTLIFAGLLMYGVITATAGAAMLILLILYIIWQAKTSSDIEFDLPDDEDANYKNMWVAGFFLLTGLVFISLGAEFLVRGAQVSASIIGIPDAVVGLTVIAIGTSLPELATGIAAARRRQTDLLLGNIIGSNVFNILSILGIASLFKSFTQDSISPQMIQFDIWAVLGVAIFFCIMIVFFKKIGRSAGVAMVLVYCAYIFGLFVLYWGDNAHLPSYSPL
jgi:cation:H+ antiporter